MKQGRDLAESTLSIVLAGGHGIRLDPLTRNVCKPALPFGGAFRNIDFSLSNCVNSGLRTIGVATLYKPESLLAHLALRWRNGATGGKALVEAWRAEERTEHSGECGTAHAVGCNLGSIRALGHPLILVLAGDHVYKMDYRPMLEAHRAHGAAVTIGCVEMPLSDSRHFGILKIGQEGRVERFVEKPKPCPEMQGDGADGALASMGIYVFDADLLARVIAIDAATRASHHDFGIDILPRLVESGSRVFAHVFRGTDQPPRPYWRDVGTLGAYWRAHMDLLAPEPLLTLYDPRWPIRPAAAAPRLIRSPSATAAGGTIESSIVTAGCEVAGKVSRSVLSDSVKVGRGAEVTESVVLPGAVIGARSRLRGVIVDAGYRVPDGTISEPRARSAPPLVLSSYGSVASGAPRAHAS